MKVVADDKIPFLRGALESHAEVVYLPGSKISREDLLNADALITRTRTKCNESLLKGTSVRCITTATIGFDHIDTSWCEENGVFWTNAPGCNSGSVQQYIAAALSVLSNELGFSPRGMTLGVVGVGNVGTKVARAARAMGFHVLLNDPPRARMEGDEGFVSLETIRQEADIITFHVPLQKSGEDKTFHLVDRSFLEGMAPGKIIMNSSRGEVVDGNALKASLESGHLAAAVLDVWENEPGIDPALLKLVSIATPHIAGYSADGKVNGTAMSVQAISRYFKLRLDSWLPANVPVPESTVLTIDTRSMTPEEVIKKAILFTYPILDDDRRLREDLGSFEKQRGDYPLRREFPVFTIQLRGAEQELARRLEEIGFKVEME
jgi:erythronate-4-phosphate dehydrogenase